MTVKELVLTSQESYADFKIQHHFYGGKIKEETMTQKLYLEIAYKEVDSFYLDVDENNQPYISMKLVV